MIVLSAQNPRQAISLPVRIPGNIKRDVEREWVVFHQ
jgi:hypothetical protein